MKQIYIFKFHLRRYEISLQISKFHATHVNVNLEETTFSSSVFFSLLEKKQQKEEERDTRRQRRERKGWVTGAQLAGGLGDPPKSLVMGTRNCKLRLSKTPRNEGLGQVDIYPPSFLPTSSSAQRFPALLASEVRGKHSRPTQPRGSWQFRVADPLRTRDPRKGFVNRGATADSCSTIVGTHPG